MVKLFSQNSRNMLKFANKKMRKNNKKPIYFLYFFLYDTLSETEKGLRIWGVNHIIFQQQKNDIGKANGAPPVIPGSSGFDSHPEIF
jgi:hypothetical protein